MLKRAQSHSMSARCSAIRATVPASSEEPSVANQLNVFTFSRVFSWILLPISFGLCFALSGCVVDLANRSASISLIPSSKTINLGSVPIGKTATTTLSLVNKNPVAVNIAQLSLTGQSFSVSNPSKLPVAVAANSTYTLDIQFEPSTPGPSAGQLMIVSDTSSSGTVVISLNGTGTSTSAVSIAVTPANVSTTPGATQQFTASVTGSSNAAVAWTLNGAGCSGSACGTISSSGLYTAPAVPPSPAAITVTATSQADPVKFASADITITPYLAVATVSGTLGRTIPQNFLGLSHEWGMAEFFAGTEATGKNLQYRQLLKNLLQYSAGTMVIRIGGNSTDTTVSLRPIDLQSVNDLNADLENNLRFTLGINMGLDDPAIATAETDAISAAVPPTSLVGLELGNEPDCWAAKGNRPASYTFAEYETQLMTWIELVANASNSQLNSVSPAFCLTNWIPSYQELLPSNNLIPELITQHYYAGEYLATQPKPPDFLLADEVATSGPTRLAPYISAAHQTGKILRIGEMNSLSNGGQPGVSDAFGSALWGVDIMFEFAKAGADGVNWHTNNGGGYGLFQFVTKTDQSTGLTDYSLAQVRPLFYGLQLFEEATSSNGTLSEVTLETNANVKVWALMGEDGLARIVILNKDETHAGMVKVTIPGYNIGTISRLLAPSVSSTTQVTLGNQTYDGSVDGTMQGQIQTEQITAVDGSLLVTMPTVSGALLTASKQ